MVDFFIFVRKSLIGYVPRTRYCDAMGPFLMLCPTLRQMDRVTLDVIRAMSVTQFLARHIAEFDFPHLWTIIISVPTSSSL